MKPNKIHIIGGPGSGKTYAANKLAKVLKLLKSNNKWSSSISLHVTTKRSSTQNNEIGITDVTFIRDHKRCEWKGTSILKTNQNEIMEEAGHVKYTIMNGEKYLLATGYDLNKFWRGHIKQSDYNEVKNLMLDDPNMGSTLWGRIYGNNSMDIYDLIEHSPNIQHRKSDHKGLECYEIEGSCKYGNIKITFSPKKGYFPLKWEITKKAENYFDTELFSGKHWKVLFQAEEIENTDGFHIPIKGRMKHDVISKDGQNISLFYSYELSNVQINPDFETINAFEFDLPSNVPVTLESAPAQ